MRFRKNPMTPVAAVIAGLLAGGRGDRMPGRRALPEIPPRRRDGQPPGLGICSGRELGIMSDVTVAA
jgi:hypothetical protein